MTRGGSAARLYTRDVARRERSSRLSSRTRWIVRILLAVFVLWLMGSAAIEWRARTRTLDGLDRLDAARDQITASALLRGDASRVLAAAHDDFSDAYSSADSPLLAPWKVVPLVRQNVASASSLTHAAADVASIGARAASSSAALLKNSPSDGPTRLALLAKLEKITAQADQALKRINLGPDFFLVAPLGDARDRFAQRLASLRSAVSGADALAGGMQRLLQGPRRYLVLVANNAEMRAGSGMFLSAGVATFANGAFTVGDFRPTPDFNLPAGAVAVPPDLEKLWGFLHPTEEWRNLASTPRFDVSASLAAQMWKASTGEDVDGVLAVDPVTVRALLAAQGPIDAAGRHLSATDVVGYLLRDQYAGVANGDPQAGRRDALGLVASAAVDTLQSRPWKTSDLVAQLGAAGQGRHVLAWAKDPTEEAAWTAGGVDGALHANSVALSLMNVGANKLDQFIHVDARMSVADASGGGHEVTVRVKVSNEAPTGLSSYVSGPTPGTGLAEGDYSAIISLNTPGFGGLARIEGLSSIVAGGVDGPTKVVAAGSLVVPRGATHIVTFRFRLPSGANEVLVESSARVPPVTWHFGGKDWSDTHPERASW